MYTSEILILAVEKVLPKEENIVKIHFVKFSSESVKPLCVSCKIHCTISQGTSGVFCCISFVNLIPTTTVSITFC